MTDRETDGEHPGEWRWSVADAIMRLFWDNFLQSEKAFQMRDVIAIELEKAEERGRLSR